MKPLVSSIDGAWEFEKAGTGVRITWRWTLLAWPRGVARDAGVRADVAGLRPPGLREHRAPDRPLMRPRTPEGNVPRNRQKRLTGLHQTFAKVADSPGEPDLMDMLSSASVSDAYAGAPPGCLRG